MKRLMLILAAALALSGCSAGKQVQQRQRLERCDTLRALLAEELTVRFDDVRIIPPDSLRPQMKVAHIALERRRAAQVEEVAAEQAEVQNEENPAPVQSGRRDWLPWALLVLILLLILRAPRAN